MSQALVNYLLAQRAQYNARKVQRRGIRDANNPFELPNTEFIKIFRLNKDMALYLCSVLEGELRPHSQDGIPVHIKILSSIRLLGDGSYQRPTGQDHCLAIAQTTVSKHLNQFVDAVISILLPRWVIFPSTEEGRRQIAATFQSKFGLPDIIGAIDCTHVAIFPPVGPQGIQYKNRKGFHSLNVQLVVDSNCKILNINARFPGRVHDQYIFNISNIKGELQRLYTHRIGSYHLLGDSGYALEPWLMTPILDAPVNSPGDLYTQWHCKVRNCVERTNGYLKGIFRCLGHDRVLHYSPEKSSKIIYTCAALYNMMVHYRVPLTDIVQDNVSENWGSPQDENNAQHTLQVAQRKREAIVNRYFT